MSRRPSTERREAVPQRARSRAERPRSAQHRHATASQAPGLGNDFRNEIAYLLPILLLAAVVFATGAGGAFVFDDRMQIAQNQWLRSWHHFWKLVTTDVWGYVADRGEAWSDYWRPAFSVWTLLNASVFGLNDTLGWHWANIALHLVVCVLAYVLLRRLSISRALSTAIVLLYSVHPTHVESITWISGSPNPLSTATLLGALLLFLEERQSPWTIGGALALYTISLLTKETSILFPIILAVVIWSGLARRDPKSAKQSRAAALVRIVPFAIVTVLYLVARVFVLGRFEKTIAAGWDAESLLRTVPSVVAFYVRQIVFPYWVSIVHPVRIVTTESASASTVLVPVLIVAAALFLLLRADRKNPRVLLASALFVLPLLPALNVLKTRLHEDLVHDRYLYLPVLGALFLIVPGAAQQLAHRTGWPRPRAERAVLCGAAFVALLFAIRTVTYNRAWENERALWEWAVRIDPNSTFAHARLGQTLHVEGDLEGAKNALDKAIAIRRTTQAVFERGTIAFEEKRYEDAEQDLRWVMANSEAPLAPYEQLAECLRAQGRLAEAIDVLREGKVKAPQFQCRIVANLAVFLHQAGRPDEILAELESVRPHVQKEYGPESRRVLAMLGLRYSELGRFNEARAAFQEYLALTTELDDPETRTLRANASRALATLPAEPPRS